MFPYQKLEKEFSNFIGVNDCVTTNTGTAALHLAIAGKDYPKGSEVIVPEFSMIATALAPHYTGCIPIYVDCKEDMNINPMLIESKITPRTRALIITHVYGRVCDMDPILDICERHNLDLFEDCCEVHGATYHDGPRKGKKVGSLGIGCFSFYRNKIIHAEEGGAICVADDKLFADHLRDLKNMSFGDSHNYIHENIGFNYRMSDSQADKVLDSLLDVNINLEKRKKVEGFYNLHLDNKFLRSNRDCVWVYDFNYPKPESLVNYLNSKNIEARRTFAPMSIQPCFKIQKGYEDLVSYRLYNSTCYLPVAPDMPESRVIEICKEVNSTWI